MADEFKRALSALVCPWQQCHWIQCVREKAEFGLARTEGG